MTSLRRMRLLDRYLLRELLTPLFFCLSGILVLCLIIDVGTNYETYQDRKLGSLDIIAWQLITLPSYVVLVFPIALLLALLYALNHRHPCCRRQHLAAGTAVFWHRPAGQSAGVGVE
jgi:hypothetical protein